MTIQPLSVLSLNARELQALVAIAHFGSLIGAAAFLQTSQSAPSRMVTRIEKLVGVRLFNRSTRRIDLTPAGREFVAVSERVLNGPAVLHDRQWRTYGDALDAPKALVLAFVSLPSVPPVKRL